MKLREASIAAAAIILLSLLLSSFAIWKVYSAHQASTKAQQNRQEAMQLVYDFRVQTLQLSKLVKAYIATSETRYLMYYYDLIGIREGNKATPPGYDPSVYWDLVIAAKIPHVIPLDGKSVSILEQMQKAGFSTAEIRTLQEIFAVSEQIKNIEQVAFAATQGLYDTKKATFVEDSKPDNIFAEKVVYGEEYRKLNSDMSELIAKLIEQVDGRTMHTVKAAEQSLKEWISLSILFTLLTVAITVVALFVVRKMILNPIQRLTFAAKKISNGDYHVRVNSNKGSDELNVLAATFNAMAKDIEDDIAIREKTHTELEEAKQIAEDATKAKSMFLANMSHEIRTPMNAIIGMTYLALKTNLTTKQREYINQVNFAANSLLGIINDILDFSKVEAGKLVLENIPFNLRDLLENIVKMQLPIAQEKGLELLFDDDDFILQKDAPPLKGDKLRLGQIITNLLSNAIKFTERGFVGLCIKSTRDSGKISVTIDVKDSGIGMSEEQIENLFQEFTQADVSTSRKYGGTGLGLAISKNITELMGGKISVSSHQGEGSIFSVEISFDIAKAEDMENEVKRFDVSDKELSSLKKMRVLLVEDNQINQKLAMALLSDKGVLVEIAENGQEAIDKLSKVDVDYFDVVLMDLQMPIMDGYEATKRIRMGSRYDNLPIVAMTAHVMSEEVHKCKEIGMQNYIGKPVEPELLYSILAHYSKKRHEDEPEQNIEDTKSNQDMAIGEIKGLNTEAGIRRAAGDVELYIDVLKDFIRLYENANERLDSAFENNDKATGSSLSHSLKGLLGTIGAEGLYVLAVILEQAFSKDGDIKSAIDAFKPPFTALVEDIKEFLHKIGD